MNPVAAIEREKEKARQKKRKAAKAKKAAAADKGAQRAAPRRCGVVGLHRRGRLANWASPSRAPSATAPPPAAAPAAPPGERDPKGDLKAIDMH